MERPSSDSDWIEFGIRQAELEQRPLDDLTAKLIAAQLQDGQRSALYAFTSTGAIRMIEVQGELRAWRAGADVDMDELQQGTVWAAHLDAYVEHHGDREPVEGWQRLARPVGRTALHGTFEAEPDFRPRVWVGALKAYEAGQMHGDWLDADVEAAQLEAAVQRIIDSSPEPDDDYGIFDARNFHGVPVKVHEPLDRLAHLGRLMRRHGEPLALYLGKHGMADLDALNVEFRASYGGHYLDDGEVADLLMDEYGIEQALQVLPLADWLRPYLSFDTTRLVHDLRANGDIYSLESSEGGFHLFFRQ